jgi:hypothetical protein
MDEEKDEKRTTCWDGDDGFLGRARRERPEALLQDHRGEPLLRRTHRSEAFVILIHRVPRQREVSEHVVAHPELGVVLCASRQNVLSTLTWRQGAAAHGGMRYAPSLSFLSMAFSISSLALRPSKSRFARAR